MSENPEHSLPVRLIRRFLHAIDSNLGGGPPTGWFGPKWEDACVTGPPYSGGRDHCCQCESKGEKRCPCGRKVR